MFCDSNGQALIWKVNCICYLISRAVDFSRILISKWRFSLGYLNSGKNNKAFLHLPLPTPSPPPKVAPAVSHTRVTAWCSPGLGCSWTFRMRPQCFMLEAKFGCHWQRVPFCSSPGVCCHHILPLRGNSDGMRWACSERALWAFLLWCTES